MSRILLPLLAALTITNSAGAAPPACESTDVAELCRIAVEARADNPASGQPEGWTLQAVESHRQRHLKRRERARSILDDLAEPTWRDLWNAGYVIGYGDTPEEQLLTLAIAIRTLSLAPDEPDARILVAMTTDKIARRYVGAQLYGRDKFIKLNRDTSALELACLPQMIDPPLPASVGRAFAPPKDSDPCPEGVGVTPLAEPIGSGRR